jgi:hypothetical protein
MAKRRQNESKFNQIISSVERLYEQSLPAASTRIQDVFSFVLKDQIQKRCFRQLVRCSERMRLKILREIVNDIHAEMRAVLANLVVAYGGA